MDSPTLLVSPPDAWFDGGVSKTYGPAKRRKVSTYRRFPKGCGRNACITKEQAAAAANNGSLPPSKEADREQIPPSIPAGKRDVPNMTRGAVEEQTGKTKMAKDRKSEESGGPMAAGGHRVGEADLSMEAIVGNPVKKEQEDPKESGDSELENAEHSLGDRRSSALLTTPTDDLFNGAVSKLFGPARKESVSATGRFPPGCGRAAAAARREEPEAARDGDSEMEVGRAKESLATFESHVKKEPDEAKGEDSKTNLRKAEAAGLANQELQRSITRKKKTKPLAIRHFPVSREGDSGEVSEGSHGGQSRKGGGSAGEDEAEPISESASHGSAMAVRGRAAPSLCTGRAEGRGSEDATSLEVCAERIVQALLASPKCPWSRRKRSGV